MSTLRYIKTFFIVLSSNLWRLYENGSRSLFQRFTQLPIFLLQLKGFFFILPCELYRLRRGLNGGRIDSLCAIQEMLSGEAISDQYVNEATL
jgi:hypothetical protein